MKNCSGCGKHMSACTCDINESPMDWDTTDSPREPMNRPTADLSKKPKTQPIKVKDAQGRLVRLPGVTSGQAKLRGEAAPPASAPDRRQSSSPFAGQNRRAKSDTMPVPFYPDSTFDVEVPGIGTYRVQAKTEILAANSVAQFLKQGQEQGQTAVSVDPNRLRVTRSPSTEGTSAGGLVGHQGPSSGAPPTYESALRGAIRTLVHEIVRKKDGGGGFVLYGPNKGKKKNPKPAGEFPTRLAAKRAELARFPPKDPEQLKRARARLDKILKDPEKRSKAERDDLSGRKRPKKSGAPARDRKKKNESFARSIATELTERLFHEDEVPGSPWDERIASLHPDAISSDKKLMALHKELEGASIGALGDAHKALSKALKGMAKVHPGDIDHDHERRKTFMPVMLDVDGTEIGPVHLYIDGGHVKVEVSQGARQAIAEMEPDDARDLRGGLMTFQEDHLPKIDQAQKAWCDRDAYLDKLHGKVEKHVSGMSGVEAHLAKQMLSRGGKKR